MIYLEKAIYLSDLKIELTFNTGEVGVVDLSDIPQLFEAAKTLIAIASHCSLIKGVQPYHTPKTSASYTELIAFCSTLASALSASEGGTACQNLGSIDSQLSRIICPFLLPVFST